MLIVNHWETVVAPKDTHRRACPPMGGLQPEAEVGKDPIKLPKQSHLKALVQTMSR